MSSLSAEQSVPAHAAGLVAVDGRGFPLEKVSIAARAAAGVAVTTLQQSYENPFEVPLEVAYTLPLPADGVVVGYTVRMGERVIRGEIEGREAARERYREALVAGQTAALLEQDRADTFHQSLGALPPAVPVEIEIEVLQPLVFRPAGDEAAPQWEYRFPTVVGVRYHGGRVEDAERLDPDRAAAPGTPVRVSLDVE